VPLKRVDGGPPQVPKNISEALTLSDRLFIEAYAQGGSLVEVGHRWAAARGKTLTSNDSASSVAFRKLGMLQRKLAELYGAEMMWEMLGLGMNQIVVALSEGMRATMVKPMLTKDGELVVAGPYPDHRSRIEAAFRAAQIRGDVKRGQGSQDVGDERPAVINVIITQYNTQVVNQGDGEPNMESGGR